MTVVYRWMTYAADILAVAGFLDVRVSQNSFLLPESQTIRTLQTFQLSTVEVDLS